MKKAHKNIIITLTVLNSISGLQINGISMNAVFMILYLLFVGILWFSKGNRKLRLKANDAVLPFLACGILSCIVSLAYNYKMTGYQSIVINYAVNSLVYILLYVMLFNLKDSCKYDYVDSFVKGLILAAKIQFCWGFAQLALFYGAGINLNKMVFVDLLHISNSSQTLKAIFNSGTWNIRVTGLTNENSYFAFIECVGLVLETNIVWRILFSAMIIVSLSRSGWVMLAAYIGLLFIKRIKKSNKKVKRRTMIIGSSIVIAIVGLFIFRNQIPALSRQIDIVFSRLTNADAINISAARHLLYYPVGIHIMLFEADPIQKLLGFGMRNSGIGINLSTYARSVFSISNIDWHSSWNLECDAMGVLLGGGLITFVAYYRMLYKEFKRDTILKNVIFIIAVGGLVYNFCSTSYTILIFMATYIAKTQRNSAGEKSIKKVFERQI